MTSCCHGADRLYLIWAKTTMSVARQSPWATAGCTSPADSAFPMTDAQPTKTKRAVPSSSPTHGCTHSSNTHCCLFSTFSSISTKLESPGPAFYTYTYMSSAGRTDAQSPEDTSTPTAPTTPTSTFLLIIVFQHCWEFRGSWSDYQEKSTEIRRGQ